MGINLSNLELANGFLYVTSKAQEPPPQKKMNKQTEHWN